MTIRRGVGGGGSGVSCGSGDGVREREKILESRGISKFLRSVLRSVSRDRAVGGSAGEGGGGVGAIKVIAKADSASRVSPSL